MFGKRKAGAAFKAIAPALKFSNHDLLCHKNSYLKCHPAAPMLKRPRKRALVGSSQSVRYGYVIKRSRHQSRQSLASGLRRNVNLPGWR